MEMQPLLTTGYASTMNTAYQRQHYVSQVLLRRFADFGRLQVFDIGTEKWKRLPPKKIFCQAGYTQLLANGQVDNTLEREFGKVEKQLPRTLAALDAAAKRPDLTLPLEIYANLCWYCAFLWRISPFAKAKAPVDFVMQMNQDLEHGRCDLLRQVVGLSENDIKAIQKAHTEGKKLIIDSKDFLQLIYRVQFVLRCKEDFVLFRHYTKWAVWNSPIELPISDIALVQVSFKGANVFVLPIAPHLLLAGTIKTGTQQKSDGTVIKSNTFSTEDAQYWADAICYSAQVTLASKSIIPDVPAMRKRAETQVNFTKIVNPESIVSAGVTDFSGIFGVRLVDKSDFVKFIHSHVRK
jgi:Protein of unknown function (DUF4238)